MKNKVDKIRELCDLLVKTYEQKNKRYGDSFNKTYKELGIISAVTRITDKTNRITQLAKDQTDNGGDESLEDALSDLALYCLMTIVERREESENIPFGSIG